LILFLRLNAQDSGIAAWTIGVAFAQFAKELREMKIGSLVE
jgi:hypothetical protein